MKTTTDLIKGTLSFVSFMANGFTVGFLGGLVAGTMFVYYLDHHEKPKEDSKKPSYEYYAKMFKKSEGEDEE